MAHIKFIRRWYNWFLAPDLIQRETYEGFKKLLLYDSQCHELIATFQDLYYKDQPVDWQHVLHCYQQLDEAVKGMVDALLQVSSGREKELLVYLKKIDSYIRVLLTSHRRRYADNAVCEFSDVIDAEMVGNKAANLCMVRQNFGSNIPPGFIITTSGWRELIRYNNLEEKVRQLLMNLDLEDVESLHDVSRELQEAILLAQIPPILEKEVQPALVKLAEKCGGTDRLLLAVRSSAVNEDGPNSYAGQYKSLLQVPPEQFFDAYREVIASKYSPEAILYRISTGILDCEAPMAVLVLQMVPAQHSGVVYTEDPTGVMENKLVVHTVSGMGEGLVSGQQAAERYSYNKEEGRFDALPPAGVTIKPHLLEELAGISTSLESSFDAPQDIEWAVADDTLFILQTRPLKITDCFSTHVLDETNNSFVKLTNSYTTNLPAIYRGGTTGARGKSTGPVCFPDKKKDENDLPEGGIMAVSAIPPSLILQLNRCRGVIASGGSAASHFATICREFGIPLLVGAEGVEEKLQQGMEITLDADACVIYQGEDPALLQEQKSRETRKNQLAYYRRLQTVLDFIAPLNILDPANSSFVPGACRTLHDIVRYAHEKGVQAMFNIGKSGSRHSYRKKLITDLPFELYAINVDNSRAEDISSEITPESIDSVPFQALWQGLTHPAVVWEDRKYYNWKEYDNAAMTDGFAFKGGSESASYAVYGRHYLNLNMKFGYHFTLVDCFCHDKSEQNYCTLRFAGGGGTFEGRVYRLQFIENILERAGFKVQAKTDLIDARMENTSREQLEEALMLLGRMLGITKQMDMVLKDEESVAHHLDTFFRAAEKPGVS